MIIILNKLYQNFNLPFLNLQICKFMLNLKHERMYKHQTTGGLIMDKKQRVHLICNAHIDPIWQWDWQEGASAVLSTFRSASTLVCS